MGIMPPTSSQGVAVPAAVDWMAVSKTIVLEGAFLACVAAIVTGHSSADTAAIAWSTGAGLGILRITDIVANVINVKSFLSKPGSGVVPQAAGTPLIATTPSNGGNTNASA